MDEIKMTIYERHYLAVSKHCATFLSKRPEDKAPNQDPEFALIKQFIETLLPGILAARDLFRLKIQTQNLLSQWNPNTADKLLFQLQLIGILNGIDLYECYFSLLEERVLRYIADKEGTWIDQANTLLVKLDESYPQKNLPALKALITEFCNKDLKGWVCTSRNLKGDLEAIASEISSAERFYVVAKLPPIPFERLAQVITEDATLVAGIPTPARIKGPFASPNEKLLAVGKELDLIRAEDATLVAGIPTPVRMKGPFATPNDKLLAVVRELEELRTENKLAHGHASEISSKYQALLKQQRSSGASAPASSSDSEPSLIEKFKGLFTDDEKSKASSTGKPAGKPGS
jgi:hypothetical protein